MSTADTSGFSRAQFERARAAACESSNALGATVDVVAACASTQDLARERAEKGAPHGTIVVTDAQQAGRGRAGRGWTQLDGALAFSVILRPEAPVAKWVRLTSLAGLALVDTTAALGATAQLKWPNDLVIEPAGASGEGPLGTYRKVAGLLVDGVMQQGTLSACVLGVGWNVGASALPTELATIAATLADMGVVTSRETALAAFCHAFEQRLQGLGDDEKMATSAARLREVSFTLGREVRLEDGSVAVAKDLDLEGALVIEDSSGAERLVWAGEVSLVAP